MIDEYGNEHVSISAGTEQVFSNTIYTVFQNGCRVAAILEDGEKQFFVRQLLESNC